MPGDCIGIKQPFAANKFDESRQRRFSRAVWAGDHREGWHAALGCVRIQFADDFVVLSGRGARPPADLEFSAIRALHHVDAIGIEIEDRKPGRQRFGTGFAASGTHGIVKLGATEIAVDSHN